MRITCPSCKAVYETPAEALGPAGRVVECSACGARWLQPAPDEAFAPAPGTAAGPEIPGLSAAAESLAELRRPAPAPRPAAPAPEAPAAEAAQVREPAAISEPMPAPPPAAAVATAPKPATGADLDARSLSAQLRGGRAEAAPTDPSAYLIPEPRRSPAGFAIGFVIALAIAGAAAGAYLERDRVAELAPDAAPMLDRYVAAVDDARRGLEDTAESVRAAAEPMADRVRDLLGM